MRNFLFRVFPFVIKLINVFPSYKIKTTIMVLSDRPKKQIDVLFFHGRAKGDDNDNIFNTVAKYSQVSKFVLINGTEDEEKCGHTKTLWIQRLKDKGVDIAKIQAFNPSFNTTMEAENMIAYAKKEGWKTAAIVAQPHQLLRCMCAHVYAMKKANYWMQIYCIAPKSVDWFEVTRGSGNQLPMPRNEHIPLEYSRVIKYSSLGHIATFKQVYQYYLKRHLIN